MTDYAAPVQDMLFAIHELAGLARVRELPGFEEASDDVVEAVLAEAGKFAAGVLSPINREGDVTGTRVEDRAVVTAPGFADAYQRFVEAGWPAVAMPAEFGGQGLPQTLGIPVSELWCGANLAFSLCPMLTQGAVDALKHHGTAELQRRYLGKLVSGEWTGTMNLTEPQAGSDLSAVKTRAVPEGEHYRLTGQKIYITWGDHDFTDNIVHLVLARAPDGPPGTKGLSLFLVPKYLPREDGSRGERNDVYPVSVEHKLGINASPTCVLSYGEGEGAIAYLVGELHNGIACMFTMMNEARLQVGLEGVGICERAYQQAVAFARERVQGTMPGAKERVTIIKHADVRRMLLTMRAGTEAMRAVAYVTAAAMDHAQHGADESAGARLALLTPVVKGWCTELAQELTSLGVQVHGGMGYIEETGAAQHLRDARITPIYEGTNGIQAMDLVGRKVVRDGGRALASLVEEMRGTAAALEAGDEPGFADMARDLRQALEGVERFGEWILGTWQEDVHAMGAAAYNGLMQLGTVCGGWQMGNAALAAKRRLAAGEGDAGFLRAKLATARFYNAHFMPRAEAYRRAAMSGSEPIMALPEEAF